MLRRNAESRNKRPDTANKPDVLRPLPTLSCESLGWENWKIITREDIWCDSSHSSHSLISLVCRKKYIFRSWKGNKPMISQVPLFNYLLKPSNAQSVFIWFLYYLSFHEEKKKRNKSLTEGICSCLIWVSLVSSNDPANWEFLILAELHRIYYRCPFYCRRIIV